MEKRIKLILDADKDLAQHITVYYRGQCISNAITQMIVLVDNPECMTPAVKELVAECEANKVMVEQL